MAGVMQGLRVVYGFHSGDDWEFYKPAQIGGRIKPKTMLADVEK